MVISESGGRTLPTVGSSVAGSDAGFVRYALLASHDRQGISFAIQTKMPFLCRFFDFLIHNDRLLQMPFLIEDIDHSFSQPQHCLKPMKARH
jgi:hypothetical protein